MSDDAESLLVVSAADLEALLPVPVAIDAVEQALRAATRRDLVLPLRTSLDVPGRPGRLILMPGVLGATGTTPARALGLKLVAKYTRAADDPLGTHVGAVLLLDADAGRLLAILEGGTLTALRTAAASALATRVLGAAGSGVAAILGAGEEAYRHAVAIAAVRPLEELRIWGRTAARVERLCARLAATPGFAVPRVRAMPDVRSAVDGAAIVCTTTSAREPIVHGAWLTPGTHLNLVGSAVPTTAEVDDECVARARVFVDYRPSADAEAGELLAARARGAIGAGHVVGELGDVLLGRVAGRTHDDEITLYKSLGFAAQDLAAAAWAYARAVAGGRGTRVAFGARHDAPTTLGAATANVTA